MTWILSPHSRTMFSTTTMATRLVRQSSQCPVCCPPIYMDQPGTHFGGVVGIPEAGPWCPTLLGPWLNLTPSPIMFPFHLQTTQTTTMTTKVRVWGRMGRASNPGGGL